MIINIYSLTSLPKFQLRIKREGSVASSRLRDQKSFPKPLSYTVVRNVKSRIVVFPFRLMLLIFFVNILTALQTRLEKKEKNILTLLVIF